MYIDMGQRIHGKQYGLIVTIAGAPWARAAWTKYNSKKKTFFTLWLTYEKLVVNYFFLLYICLHLDEVCIFWDFGTLGFGVRPSGRPKPISRPQPHKSINGINGTPQHFYIMLQGPRNILRTFHHRVDTCTRMTNEQLIFHIYGSHCEKYIYIYIYICGTWGPFNNHSGSILLLRSPFTNINLHVKNPKYDFCSCLGGPGDHLLNPRYLSVSELRPHHNGDIFTTRKMTSSSYMGHDVKKLNNIYIWGALAMPGGGLQ